MTNTKRGTQVGVIVTFLLLLGLVVFGFFRFEQGLEIPFLLLVFLGGVLGASINFLRDLHLHADSKGVETLSMVSSLCSRILIGGGLAVGVYMLFISGLLGGALFPEFENVDYASSRSFLNAAAPHMASDFGKCMVWAFLAGYSERFLPGLLSPTK